MELGEGTGIVFYILSLTGLLHSSCNSPLDLRHR